MEAYLHVLMEDKATVEPSVAISSSHLFEQIEYKFGSLKSSHMPNSLISWSEPPFPPPSFL